MLGLNFILKTKFVQDLAYAMDTNDSGDIDLPEFLHLMGKKMADSNLEEDINEAFKVKVLFNVT
jgi:Ca2+-binding EF-hand superfamily protein